MNECSVKNNMIGLTYISVAVTGVPTRNLANRKLKMRAVDPSGATYSTYSCQGKSESMIVKKAYRLAYIQGQELSR